MIDFAHTKRPEFIQLVLIIAVACLALGAITPAASAGLYDIDYDWEFSVQTSPGTEFTFTGPYQGTPIYQSPAGYPFNNYYVRSSTKPDRFYFAFQTADWSVPNFEGLVREFVYSLGLSDSVDDPNVSFENVVWLPPRTYPFTLIVPPGSTSFNVDVVDSGTDYLISVSGIDGTQLAGSAYTIAVSTFTGGYKLPITSYPMYQGDSPVHIWDSDETFTLPVYLSDGVTPIDYYCMLSFPADPTYTGYPFWWNLTVHGSSGYPFDTDYPPVTPIPTHVIPEDIIPHPDDLNNTVNITGWYQDQGFEGNNITAPIYSGIRGWFNENLIPVIDFFLTPTNYVASVISDSSETSTDGISYITEELGSYAAPFNTVGAYVVRLVPEVVWLVVFAALSIGYVVLLIRISTGSIKDTIGRFLGGSK